MKFKEISLATTSIFSIVAAADLPLTGAQTASSLSSPVVSEETLLIVSQKDLRAKKNRLEEIIAKNPDFVLTINVEGAVFCSSPEPTSELRLDATMLPTGLQHVVLVDIGNKIQEIGFPFLSTLTAGHPTLRTVDMSGLKHVRVINNHFLSQFPLLTHLDLSSFTQLEKVGEDCFSTFSTSLGKDSPILTALISKDTHPKLVAQIPLTTNVTLKEAKAYKVDVMKGDMLTLTTGEILANKEDIEARLVKEPDISIILTVCGDNNGELHLSKHHIPSGLKHLTIQGDASVTKVGYSFLNRCDSLTTIKFVGMDNVKTIQRWFLHSLPLLESLDLSGLRNIEHIERDALQGSGLQKLVLDFPNLKHIEGWFLSDSRRLQKIEFNTPSLEILGCRAFDGCTSLHTLDMRSLKQVKTIDTDGLGTQSISSNILSAPLKIVIIPKNAPHCLKQAAQKAMSRSGPKFVILQI